MHTALFSICTRGCEISTTEGKSWHAFSSRARNKQQHNDSTVLPSSTGRGAGSMEEGGYDGGSTTEYDAATKAIAAAEHSFSVP